MSILNNQTLELLASAGISQTAQRVYDAGFGKTQTSSQLTKRTKLPRPTVMAALKLLRERGLCTVHRLDGRSFSYEMLPPAMLKASLASQIRQLADIMTQLDAIPTSHESVAIKEVEGQAAVQEVLELALQCRSRQWRIIAPHGNALRYMPKSYTDYFKQVRRDRQIVSETLWEEARKDDPLPLHDLLMRKPRFIPSAVSKEIPSLLLAFDDSLIAISGTTNPVAVLMQNKAIVTTFNIIFDVAWRSCRV